jgi:tetratricopeptide (TPR) repeat protein
MSRPCERTTGLYPWLALVALLITAGPCAATPVEQARALLDAGRAEEAYELLSPLEDRLAGDPAYDYLLAVAALDAGRPDEAVLAFERVLAADPLFAGARLDLGRAYFALGAFRAAEAELRTVLGQDPPQHVRAVAEDYLARMAGAGRPTLRLSGSLEATAGWDSNANAAADLQEFLGFQLLASSKEADSTFAEAGARLLADYPLDDALSVVASAGAYRRVHSDAAFVNTTRGDASLSLRRRTETSLASVGLLAYRLDTGGELNSQAAGVVGRLRADVSPEGTGDRQVGLDLRWLAIRYGDDAEVRDVDQGVLGLSLGRALGAAGQHRIGASLVAGREWAKRGGSPFGRDFYGVRLDLEAALADDLRLYAAGAWQRSEYDGRFFGAGRQDDRVDASLGLAWKASRHWLLRPELAYTDNDSDVALYAYDRTVVGITLRRELF